MTEILAELNRRIHDISIHTGTDFETDVACFYALEDALNDARLAAEIHGIAL